MYPLSLPLTHLTLEWKILIIVQMAKIIIIFKWKRRVVIVNFSRRSSLNSFTRETVKGKSYQNLPMIVLYVNLWYTMPISYYISSFLSPVDKFIWRIMVWCHLMINHLIDIKVTLSLLQEMQRWYVTFVLVTEVHVSTF